MGIMGNADYTDFADLRGFFRFRVDLYFSNYVNIS